MRRFIILFAVTGLVVFVWQFTQLQPFNADDSKGRAFAVLQGDSLSTIASHLHEAGLIRSEIAFKLYARFSGASRLLKAGTFALSPSMSVSQIIEVIESGKSEEFFVTIPEGYTVAEIDALLARKGLGQPGDIINCAFRCDFSTFDFLPSEPALGGEALEIGSRLEGYLFPETYAVSPSEYVPKFFLERMLGTFRSRVIRNYADDLKKNPHSLHEIVTMASLVEEESRHDDERSVVAGILWKRLENGVVLGVDATTRYRLSKKTDVLTKADVEIESAYNTRRTQGLPPSPIANPGESSLISTLNPTESKYWYYLHGNDGQIRYAVTNDEHNMNRAKYLR